jgi:hypothetical protein
MNTHNLTLLLELAGMMHLGLMCAGALMPRAVNLRAHLAVLPPFIRRLYWVYYAFIGLCLVSFGLLTVTFAGTLAAGGALARAVCAFLAVFWTVRLFAGSLRVGGLERRDSVITITPTMHGLIDRRMLVNFRVEPEVVRKFLPPYFRPKLVKGWAMAGICLIRLKDIRPSALPLPCGITSENAAHRIAVEWEEAGVIREGVFIPRRDTSSVWQAFAGGRFFPGVHHTAEFEVREGNDEFRLHMRSCDDEVSVEVNARRASQIPETSIFTSLNEASEFFARGSVGYSATDKPNCCDGLELITSRWEVEPLEVRSLRSSFFEDKNLFPHGTVHFDCAFLMRNIEHEWHVLPRMKKHV